jgi:exodeoxyribonuclease-5
VQASPQQEKALQQVDTWIKDKKRKPIFRLFGYAGTGKTTLAKHFASNLDGDVMFGAFTGKAAHVLKTKGCENASTIHSMIYHVAEKSRKNLIDLEIQLAELLKTHKETDEKVISVRKALTNEKRRSSQPSFSLKADSDISKAALVVIDECSMVDQRMGEDLLSFGTPILVLGDPAQLPPIMGGGFFTENCEPDVMLTEIHRQARDNPIIDMATRVRNGETLPLGQYVLNKTNAEDILAADQVLVGKNLTRKMYNARIRQLKGFVGELPLQNDKLVCLRNNHDLGLLNGALWTVKDIAKIDEDNNRIEMAVAPEDGGQEVLLTAHMQPFLKNAEEMAWWEKKEAQEFDYGYALTVHKSQGSQWDKVVLFDESNSFKKDARRWLYTGITRAAEEVKIVRL